MRVNQVTGPFGLDFEVSDTSNAEWRLPYTYRITAPSGGTPFELWIDGTRCFLETARMVPTRAPVWTL
jgi:hypothetical protein